MSAYEFQLCPYFCRDHRYFINYQNISIRNSGCCCFKCNVRSEKFKKLIVCVPAVPQTCPRMKCFCNTSRNCRYKDIEMNIFVCFCLLHIYTKTRQFLDCFTLLLARHLADVSCFIGPSMPSGICMEIHTKIVQKKKKKQSRDEGIPRQPHIYTSIYRLTSHIGV